jgi:hypothetical protein
MADVGGLTLMMAIQALHQQIRYYEQLLTSETLRDPEKIQSLILSYENAGANLKEAYLEERKTGSNLPSYEILVRPFPID